MDKAPDSAIKSLAFPPDGKLLVAGGVVGRTGRRSNPAPIPVWEVSSGKLLRKLEGLESRDDLFGVAAVAFTPNSKTIGAGNGYFPAEFYRWEADTGKQIFKAVLPGTPLVSLGISPDGSLVVCQELRSTQLDLYRPAEGRKILTLDVEAKSFWSAFSPDGRFLATGAWKGGIGPKVFEGGVRVWELASGKEVLRFNPGASVTAIAFSGDGKTLATGHANATVLLWKLFSTSDKARESAGLWADLASEDASKAHRAVTELLARPQSAVSLLKSRLRPVKAVDPETISKLIAELRDKKFATRQHASRALEELGEEARGGLETFLKDGKPELEVKRRVENILKLLALPASSPGLLRGLRAVLVLERVGSTEARQILSELSKGEPQATLTREAAAALRRVERWPG
jgi:hypothetical protein